MVRVRVGSWLGLGLYYVQIVNLYNWFFPMINANETHHEQGFDVPSKHNPGPNPNPNPTMNPN